jgi:hypothetical protein
MRISLNQSQMDYLMNEFHVHQVVPDNNSIVGGFIMVLKHHRVGRSLMLLTHYSTEEGLLWHKDKGGEYSGHRCLGRL